MTQSALKPTSPGPLVSVVICVYNAGLYFRESLLSVLRQSYANLEILIIDDGSTDGCIEAVSDLLTDPRVRVIRQANRGKPAAMNVALEQLRGEFYVVNDADDLSDVHRVQLQLNAMLEHPGVAAVYCGYRLIINNRVLAPLAEEKDEVRCRQDIERFVMPSHDPTGMYRMSLVGSMRYEPELPIVEGYDYILRIGERFPMRVVGTCLYDYRIHSQSITKQNPERRNRLVYEVLQRACQRRGLSYEKLFPVHVNGSRADCHREQDNNLAAHFMDSVCWQRESGWNFRSIATGLQCVRLHPVDPHYWKALAYALLPQGTVRWIRKSRWQTSG